MTIFWKLVLVNVTIGFCHGSKLTQLEAKVESTLNELHSTKDLLNGLTKDLQATKLRLQETEKLLFLKEKKSARQQVPPSHTGIVAFHARASAHQTNVAQHQTIIFHQETVNDYNGYNNKTGVFTCPSTGLYYFTMTIMTDPGKQVETELVKNGDNVMIVYSGATSNHWNTGTNSVVVRLREGDRVWVRILNNYVNDGTNMVHGDGWTTWTGFLLQEEE